MVEGVALIQLQKFDSKLQYTQVVIKKCTYDSPRYFCNLVCSLIARHSNAHWHCIRITNLVSFGALGTLLSSTVESCMTPLEPNRTIISRNISSTIVLPKLTDSQVTFQQVQDNGPLVVECLSGRLVLGDNSSIKEAAERPQSGLYTSTGGALGLTDANEAH